MIATCHAQLDTDNNLYQEDLYFWFPALKRTFSLVRGYRTLIDSGNYYAALPLIRLVLDCGLRFASLWFVADRRAFFEYINNRSDIRKYKDDQNKNLTDVRLVERVGVIFPPKEDGGVSPVTTLYSELCSFIHLNDRHIATLKNYKQPKNPKTDRHPFSIGSDGDILTKEEKVVAANHLHGALVVVRNVCMSWERERADRTNNS